MTIADEIIDLQNNLSAAKNAVIAKRGTAGDTGLAGLSSEISTIPSGGGDATLGIVTYTKNGQSQTAVIRTTSEFMQLCSTPTSDIKIDSQTFRMPDITRVALEDAITYIPDYFLRGATALTSLSFGPLTHIGRSFLVSCESFNQPLTIPNTVTEIGENFLYQCYAFNSPLVIGSGIQRINNGFMISCHSFNQPLTVPNNILYINQFFLQNCNSFNSQLTLSNNIISIGDYFLYDCNNFNQDVSLPTSLVSVGNRFMYLCNNMTSQIKVYNSGHPSDVYSLATTNVNAPLYTTGVTVVGGTSSTQAYAQTWKDSLSDSAANPYRKLILGTPA